MKASAIRDYERIEQAIFFLQRNAGRHPGLKEAARSVNLSEYHFQRLFRRWAGITPKRFLQVLTLQRTKGLMKHPGSLLDLTEQAGLSSAGRLHDLFVTIEAVTPREFREQGRDLSIRYGFHPSPFGECLIALTDRGITNLSFVQEGGRSRALADLRKQWKHAVITEGRAETAMYVQRIFGAARRGGEVRLVVKGTNFQVKVWQALLHLPEGKVSSYADVAAAIGRPKAVRAAANAVAGNRIGYLIPCHRVIRKTGAIGGYRWGAARKAAMLVWENGARRGVSSSI